MNESIKKTISTFPLGEVFSALDFTETAKNPKGVSKILNDLVVVGELRKLSKGRFYKPEIGKFGELKPETYQVIKDLLVRNGQLIGYTTGYSIFNELLLTTQVSAVIQIGMRKEKRAIIRDDGLYRIHFIKQENIITEENIPILRLLDCLRFFKIIPDTTPDKACQRLLQLIQKLNEKQVSEMKELVLNYTPQAIALSGAILETVNPRENTEALLKKLNPMTDYKLSISEKVLPTKKKWRII